MIVRKSLDDISAILIGQVVEIHSTRYKFPGEDELDHHSKTIYAGVLDGYEYTEERLIAHLNKVGSFQFTKREHSIEIFMLDVPDGLRKATK